MPDPVIDTYMYKMDEPVLIVSICMGKLGTGNP